LTREIENQYDHHHSFLAPVYPLRMDLARSQVKYVMMLLLRRFELLTKVFLSSKQADIIGNCTAFLDGVSGTAGDPSYAQWLGHEPSIAGTWCDTLDAQTELWTIQPDGDYGSWDKPLDIAIGAIYKDAGESWARAASGAYTSRWKESLQSIRKYWGSRPASLLFIRFAHGFNYDGRDWSVSRGELRDFLGAWRAFRAIQQHELPEANLVWCVNDETSESLELDVRNAFPGLDQCEVVGVDTYNAWPWLAATADLDARRRRRDGFGAPAGVEAWRLQAKDWGLPLAIPEWGSSAFDVDGSGGGDSPAYMRGFVEWMKANGGNGPGNVLYAIYLNIGDQYRIFPVEDQPKASEQYRKSFAGLGACAAASSKPDSQGEEKGGETNSGNPGTGTGGASSAGQGYPSHAISVYKMMWSSNGPKLSDIPSGVNVIRLAFAQGSPPSLVGWGNQEQSSFLSDVAVVRSRGGKILVSVGGSDGAVDTSNREAFLRGIDAINRQVKLDGLDWDIEASQMNQADVVFLAQQLKKTYGSSFAITFAPNGGNVDEYLPTALACHRAGVLDEYGQQLYDSEVSVGAAEGRIQQALDAGLPQEKLSVGMMIASDRQHWTNTQCAENMKAIRQRWPGITKAYLWEASRSGTTQWVADMQRILSQ